METMINSMLENFSVEVRHQITRSISHYKSAGIEAELLDISGDSARIKIKQARLVNGYILNQKQLIERGREIFSDIGLNIKVVPVVYSLQVSEITVQWIEEKMEELGIKRNDLVSQLALDKTYISRLFSGNINLSGPMRALFFYYFTTYELNKDLRAMME